MDETVRGGQEPGEAKTEPGADDASREQSVADAPAPVAPAVPLVVPGAAAVAAPPPTRAEEEERAEPRPAEPVRDPADAPHVPEHIFGSPDEAAPVDAGKAEQDAPAPPHVADARTSTEHPSLNPGDGSREEAGAHSSEAASVKTSEAGGPPIEAPPSEIPPVVSYVESPEEDSPRADHHSCDDPSFATLDDRAPLDQEADASVLDQAPDSPPPEDDVVSEPITVQAPDAPPAEPTSETFNGPALVETEAQPPHTDVAATPGDEGASEQAEILDDTADHSSLSDSAAPTPDAEPAAADASAPDRACAPAVEVEPELDPPEVDVPEVGVADPTVAEEAHEPPPVDDAPESLRPQPMPDPPVHAASSLPEPEIAAHASAFEPVHQEPDEPAKPLHEDQIWSSPEADDADQHRPRPPRSPPLSIGAFAIHAASIGNAAASRAMEQPVPSAPAFPSVSLPSRETLDQGRSYVRLAAYIAGAAVIALATTVLILILLYRWIDPPTSTLMLGQRLLGTEIEQRWVPIERVSPHLIQAIILSEDGAFCRHRGVDWAAMSEAIESARGGSTITMQVVKNLFLWPARSYVRKALEIALAYIVEVVWSKQRILEIYLNIAEWGPGVFGAEAAARNHFGKRASQLTAQEAALLAVSLPNPIERQAGHPGWQTRRLAGNLLIRMRAVRSPVRCVRGG